MPKIDDFKANPKFRAWDKNSFDDIKIEKPFKKGEDIEKDKIKSKLRSWDDDILEQLTHKKPATNATQTEAKLKPNQSQTEAKLKPNQSQTEANNIKFIKKLGTELGTELEPNQSQSRSKLEPKEGFFSLSLLQKNVTNFIYNLCEVSRNKKTDPISINQISTYCQTTDNSAKKAIQRLQKKNIIIRNSFKNGRGGWTIYELSNSIFQEILYLRTRAKLEPNQSQSRSKLGTQLGTELEPTPLSSSSININNITTTTERDVVKEIGEEYKNIDSSSLEKIGFGFTQISQLFEKNIDPNLIQESINHFAFALENNEKIKQNENPLNLFMGVLRKGRAWVESNYESVKTIELRALLELKKKEKEDYEAILAELFELEYNTWFTDMTDEELKKLLPNADFKYGRHVYEIEQQAKILFKNTKWIKILNQIKKAIPNQL